MAETYVKMSEGTALTASGMQTTDKFVLLRPGVQNLTLQFSTLMERIFSELAANYVTLTGTQILTNKTLTTPKINGNINLTATSVELNHSVGVTAPIQTQINSVVTMAQDNEESIISLQEAVSVLATNEYRKNIVFTTGSLASTKYLIDKDAIKGQTQQEINPNTVLIQYYEVSGNSMVCLAQSGITINKDSFGLTTVELNVESSKTYNVVISYQLYE